MGVKEGKFDAHTKNHTSSFQKLTYDHPFYNYVLC